MPTVTYTSKIFKPDGNVDYIRATHYVPSFLSKAIDEGKANYIQSPGDYKDIFQAIHHAISCALWEEYKRLPPGAQIIDLISFISE